VPGRNTESPRLPGGLRALRGVVVGLLLLSTALTLFAVPQLRGVVAAGRWPPAALLAPPIFLAAFVAGFAVYRIALVRLGRYPAGKALVQIGLVGVMMAVVAGMILYPETEVAAGRPIALEQAFRAQDATTRALAAEVARHRPAEEARRYGPGLADLLDDPSPEVRRQAHGSLVAIAGSDLGGEGPGAAARWRAHLATPPPP
jgi:hypothetical protein